MTTVDFTVGQAQRLLRLLLKEARKTNLSVEGATTFIKDGLDHEGMGRGFLSFELEVAQKLRSVTVTIGLSTDYSERTFTVS